MALTTDQLEKQLRAANLRGQSYTSDALKANNQNYIKSLEQQLNTMYANKPQQNAAMPSIGQPLVPYKGAQSQFDVAKTPQVDAKIEKPPVIDGNVNKDIKPAIDNAMQEKKDVNPYNDYSTKVDENFKTTTDAINQAAADKEKLLAEEKAAALARVRALIASRTAGINSQISTANTKFQPLREQVDVRRAQDLQRARELLAAQGIIGGDNLTSQMNVNTGASDQMAGIDQTQQEYITNLENERNQLAFLEDEKSAEALRNYYAGQRDILSTKATDLANAQNAKATNLFNAMEKMQARKDAEQSRSDNALLQQGLVIDPATGDIVKTSSQKQLDLSNKITETDNLQKALDKKKNDYESTIGRFYNDFQAEINNVQNDNDPTNDWQIPILQQARQGKIAQQLQDSIKSIGQYNNDYQAEINRRQQTPNTTDDNLIPYLKIAQAEKVQNMKSAEISKQQQQQKDALTIFKELGYATPEIAAILGIPERATTTDYLKTQYDISKPYYKEGGSSDEKVSKQDMQKSMAEDIATIQSYPVKDAVKLLEDNKEKLIATYGLSGYKDIWNSALSKAIAVGQAKPYGYYEKE